MVFSDATLEGIHAADPVAATRSPSTACTGTRSRSGCRVSGSAATATGWRPSSGRHCSICCSGAPSRRASTSASRPRSTPTNCWRRATTWSSPPTAPTPACATGSPTCSRRRPRPRRPSSSGWAPRTRSTGLTFVHERGPHGVFAVHGYPIGSGVSTFIVETDEESWRAAGLDEFDVDAAPRPERREDAGLPAGPVRRADRRAPAAGQQLPVGQLPHPPRAPVAAPGRRHRRRSARRRRAHRPLLGRLRHQDGHGGRRRAGGRARRAPGRRRCRARVVRDGPAAARSRRSRTPRGPSLSWWEHFGRSHDTLPAVAVRLPLLHPQPDRVEAAPPRRRSSSPTSTSAGETVHGAEPLRQPPRGRRSAAGRAGRGGRRRRGPPARTGRCLSSRDRPTTAAPGASGWPPPPPRTRCPTAAGRGGEGRSRGSRAGRRRRRHRADPSPALRGGTAGARRR